MPLRHVLYRCPRCGHDPTQGRGDAVSCPACGARFLRRRRGVEVREEGRSTVEPVAALVDAIDALGGPLTAAMRSDGSLRYASDVRFQGFLEEAPEYAGTHLLGFVERPGPVREGEFAVDEATLSFMSGDEGHAWALDDVTALQVSTRSLQIGIRGQGTLQLTFPSASTFRWEALLHHLIRGRWRARGLGEITEFQPRITAR